MEFKVGDRVRYVVQRGIDNVKVGEVGIIRGISPNGSYAVDFEESGYKHNCDGLCQSNHGWWCSGDTLEPVDSKTFDLPEFVFDAEQAKELAERLNKELAGRFNAFLNDGISANKGGKNPMKFTFYVKEGTRPDKKCNGTIPTMTTTVVDASGKKATVTCDKADYNERQGVLEAIAQMACGGNFDKEYGKAVKKNKLIELHDRTCTYCGKVFDTIAEREEHEAWHVECRKARHERYLLRKRAKEIAFEEQAQKMAKEMVEK